MAVPWSCFPKGIADRLVDERYHDAAHDAASGICTGVGGPGSDSLVCLGTAAQKNSLRFPQVWANQVVGVVSSVHSHSIIVVAGGLRNQGSKGGKVNGPAFTKNNG